MDSALFCRDYHIEEEKVGNLNLEIDNISFFKDNEWEGMAAQGYTLPGLWLQAKATYAPIPELQLEAGVHTLLYSGTTKYPNTIYQDIAVWKGSQYQDGTHLLPFYRAHLQLKNLHFVLGNLYGGSTHRLSDALYSAELNLTSDPETGLQLIYDTSRLHLDAWVNWQSFIFRGDTHKESFVFGLSTHYSPVKNLDISLSALAHHRGGEIDTLTVRGINTVMNGSLGIRYNHPTPHLRWLRSWSLGADILGYAQQAGKLWPVDKGWALYGEGRMMFAYGISAKLGYMLNRNFISMLSYPYYGCLSVHKLSSGATFHNPQMLNAQVDWTRKLGSSCAIGLRAELFHYIRRNGLTLSDGTFSPGESTNSMSFGIFLRATPSFILLKKKKD